MEVVVNTKLVRRGPHCPLCCKPNPLLAFLMRLRCKHTLARYTTQCCAPARPLPAPAMQALADREQLTTSLAIAHLKSYQHMGQAGVICLEGCACEAIEIDGHQEERNSQTHISMVEVSAAGVCTCRTAGSCAGSFAGARLRTKCILHC